MGYELFIKRNSSPLTLGEWVQAVDATPGVELAFAGPAGAIDPATGKTLDWPITEGTVQMKIGNEMAPVFDWFNGEASFRAGYRDSDWKDIVSAALSLAEHLGGLVIGEDDVEYKSLDDFEL
jgi:hypothetical protein